MNKARNLVEMGEFYAASVLTEAKKNFPPKDTFAVAGKKVTDNVIPSNLKKPKAFDQRGPKANKNEEALVKPLEAKDAKGKETFTGVEKLSLAPEKMEVETINNFMNKSIFDRLFEDVMSDNVTSPESAEQHDALALDLPGTEAGGEEGEVTLTLSKELAEKLHDALMAVLGSDEEQHSEEELEGEPESEEDAEEHVAGCKCEKCLASEDSESTLPEATELEALPDSKGLSLQSKNNKVGDETAKLVSKGHGEGGKLTSEPELKPVSDSKGKSLEGKNNKVASKTSKVGSYLAGLK
jgi:hypothetical protein